MIINLPNETSFSKASENLKHVLDAKIEVSQMKKLAPKLTFVGLPKDIKPDELKNKLCEKDELLKDVLEKGDSFEIIGSWDIKDNDDNVSSKKVAAKVSPAVRQHFMERNQGYAYINLCRFRVFDRLNVSQCFHCYGYNHHAKDCPSKTKSPVCGRCSKPHSTKDCKSNHEKCINCLKRTPNKPNNHCAFSYKCPVYEIERNLLMSRTDYSTKN